MEQVALNVTPRLSYAAENFVLHAGISPDFERCVALLQRPAFSICFYTGAAGSGKTHLALKLAEVLLSAAYDTRSIEAQEFLALLEAGQKSWAVSEKTVFIIDQAEQCLDALSGQDSGKFVDFIEHLRQRQAGVVFLSAKNLCEFGFDQHIRSRLLPGDGFSIHSPAEQDLPGLLAAMLAQRGIALSERKLVFLAKRLPRDTAAIAEYLSRLEHLALVSGGALDFSLLAGCL